MSYQKTKKIWTNWWGEHASYGKATSSIEHIDKTRNMIKLHSELLGKCSSMCELGIGNGRSLYYFHEAYPDWDFRGNDIFPKIKEVISVCYPKVLDFADIAVQDTLAFLKECPEADLFLTFGHLMHIPNDVIGEVCDLIIQKAQKYILVYEAFPHNPRFELPDRYNGYRFERDYRGMFKGSRHMDIKIDDNDEKGTRQALYMFEGRDG